MAIPVLRSLNQIIKAMTQVVVPKSGVSDLNTASVNRSLIEAAAMSDFRTQGDIMAALGSIDIDNATGPDLDAIGKSKDVERPQAAATNGYITVSQQGFVKVSTKIYQGTAAPPAYSTVINIADSTGFPPSGAVYLGRGTNNYEGPVAYSAITQVGTYYQLTLSGTTTKNHNVGETVILAQGGNRTISAGSLAQTASNLNSTSVSFKVLTSATLLDGEASIANIPVVCTQTGAIGNVQANSIVSFANNPFPNAVCTNPLPYTTGANVMDDDTYRDLIKNTEQSLTKGTPLAIEQAAIGISSTDDNQTVVSAQFSAPSDRTEPGILYIDNGFGYEPIFTGQGFEQILNNASGGELYLQLQNQDVVKAAVLTSFSAPFAVAGGMTLAVLVGGVRYEHTFGTADFSTNGSAATDEIVNSINGNSNLAFNARAFNNDSQILLFAKAFVNEDMQVVSPTYPEVDANAYLGFNNTLTYSLRLYKNDYLLIKDGIVPSILSAAQSSWQTSIVNGATLKVQVDGTPVQAITINDVDFVPYGFPTVNRTNSLTAWASVLNSKLAGVTVSVNGNQLEMVSNKGANNNAKLTISSSNTANSLANGDGMLTPTAVSGRASDYSFNRATGQVELVDVAAPGDSFTAGSQYTRGFVDSTSFSAGSLTLQTSPVPQLYFIVDSPAEQRSVSLSNLVSVGVTNPSTNVWRYTFSVTGVVSGIAVDDIVVITTNAGFSANNVGHWRVTNVDGTGTYFDVIKTTGTVEGPIALTSPNDIVSINSKIFFIFGMFRT